MSQIVTTYPIVGALLKTEKLLGHNRLWGPTNDVQRRFLSEIFVPCRSEQFSPKQLQSFVAWSADEINALLKEYGFDIRLTPFVDENSFGIASIFTNNVEWKASGVATTVSGQDGVEYPAVRLSDEIYFYRHGQHHHPICAVTTMSGDIMYLTMFDQGLDDLDLITMAEKLTRGMLPIDEFGDVVFPMVDINQEVDVSWLVDMETFRQDGRRAWIAQAKQETSLRINEIRAAMRSAFTAEVANESMMVSRPDMVINGSFLCWFWRPGLSKPLLVSHVQREDWKNPGVIEPKK